MKRPLKCSECKRPLPGVKGGAAAWIGMLACSDCARDADQRRPVEQKS